MKKASNILLGVVSSLNLIKFLIYLVFVIVVIMNASRYSASPGWLLQFAFVGAVVVVIFLIPYAVVLFLSFLLYILSLIKKRKDFSTASSILSIIGSVAAIFTTFASFLLIYGDSAPDMKVAAGFLLVILYFLAEAILALVAFIFHSKKN